MRRLDQYAGVEGVALRALVASVRERFVAAAAYEEFEGGFCQPNTVRIVTVQVFEGMSASQQLAVLEDLLVHNADLALFEGEATSNSGSSDTPATYILDLICDVVWQALMADDRVRVEDEVRVALAEAVAG